MRAFAGMDEALQADMPFVKDMPRREKTRWQKLNESIQAAQAITREKGMLFPVGLAAKFCDVSTQRIHDLMQKGTLERVELDGHPFVTQASLIAWASTPASKGGRPRKFPLSVKDAALAGFKYGLSGCKD